VLLRSIRRLSLAVFLLSGAAFLALGNGTAGPLRDLRALTGGACQ